MTKSKQGLRLAWLADREFIINIINAEIYGVYSIFLKSLLCQIFSVNIGKVYYFVMS